MSEIDSLLHLSARLGHEPLLVQASSGNTSLKLGGTLWIKASGRWLADAEREEILVPVDLSTCVECFKHGRALPACDRSLGQRRLHPSIETLMHAVLPQRVVIHVHSVSTIAWAVRSDAQLHLSERLAGLHWKWIPYAPSGLLLAREIESACSRSPQADVFVLGNHGLVVCGEDSRAAESLLLQVERRLATSRRLAAKPKCEHLEHIERLSRWRLPNVEALHALGTDAISRRIAEAGVLYPCQAIFLGRALPLVPCSMPLSAVAHGMHGISASSPFLVVEGSGVLIHENITRAECDTLNGFVEVVQRIATSAPIQYLTEQEVNNALGADGQHYKAVVAS